ncbi:MAG: helix-turn-helix transcriptional regulator [Chloroflexi bacterium]|nr:helix-turn-helix transcriptional regulator [Chloroflexota bacterium]
MKTEELEPFCPYYHRAVELIGRRWSGAILRAMLAGVSRFNELAETIPGLSPRMLSERLKELEAEGVVVRSVIPTVPVRVEYHLTEKGQSLGSVVEAVARWAEQWADPPAEGTAVSASTPSEVES